MRTPAGLGPLGDLAPLGDVGALPRRSRRWPWLLMLLPLLLLVPWPEQERRAPTSLSGAELGGERGAGCVRLALLADGSGSMSDYAQARTAAVQEVLRWAPTALRGDDQLTVVDFAGSAATTLPTTPVADSATARVLPPVELEDGSALSSGLEELAAQGPSPCRTVAVVVSDGLVDETDPAAVDALLRRAGVDRVVLLLPSRTLDVPSAWTSVLPRAQATATDGLDPRATALALGNVLADYLGLELETT